jgi:hypothetical protein
MSHRSGVLFSVVVLAVSGALLGCKPKPGDKCKDSSSASCSSPAAALVCVSDVLTSVPCHGAKGCSSTANTVECDNSLSNVGDTCLEQGDISCGVDKKSALECDTGKFKLAATCKGSGGCQVKPGVKGNLISCDNNVADDADPCHTNGDYACSSDKKFILKCDDHKFSGVATCRGPKACRVFELPEEKKVQFSCDDTMALENDPCDQAGEFACSMDQKAIYTCKGNKYVVAKACPGGCSYDEKARSLSCSEAGGAKTVMAKTVREGKAGSGVTGGTPSKAAGGGAPALAASAPVAAAASVAPAADSKGKTVVATAPSAAAGASAKGAAATPPKGLVAPVVAPPKAGTVPVQKKK